MSVENLNPLLGKEITFVNSAGNSVSGKVVDVTHGQEIAGVYVKFEGNPYPSLMSYSIYSDLVKKE